MQERQNDDANVDGKENEDSRKASPNINCICWSVNAMARRGKERAKRRTRTDVYRRGEEKRRERFCSNKKMKKKKEKKAKACALLAVAITFVERAYHHHHREEEEKKRERERERREFSFCFDFF